MYKLLLALLLSISISACSPEKTAQTEAAAEYSAKIDAEAANRTTSAEINNNSHVLQIESESKPQNPDQVKDIANSFDVSQDKVLDTAGRASELSGGKASKQDMLDALEAFSN